MTPANIIRLAWACAVLVVILAVGSIGYRLGSSHSRIALAEYKADVAAKTAKVADLATKAERIARETEQAHAAQLNDVATQYEADKRAIETNADRLVADLRAGNERLHQRWQAALATSELSRTVASAAELDAAARDREESASRAISAADQCDAQVIGLQDVIRADRER